MGKKHDYDLTRGEVLQHALRLGQFYSSMGMSITLRQLHYRFIATGLYGSGDHNYKRLGDVLNEARFSGDFPMDLIIDRGRELHPGRISRLDTNFDLAVERGKDFIKENLANWLIDADPWVGQENFVSVWVEKQALEGVFEGPCNDLGVSWLACKGYPSTSLIWEWMQRAQRAISGQTANMGFRLGAATWEESHAFRAKRAIILYFGDHDPDGLQIPKSAIQSIRALQDQYDIDFDIELHRIALNTDQIEQYNPPSFDAKVTSSRFQAYYQQTGLEEAWELDALEPPVLDALIRREVAQYYNPAIHKANQDRVRLMREKFTLWAEDLIAADEYQKSAGLDPYDDPDDPEDQ